MTATNVPHFAYPFTMAAQPGTGALAANTVEQDSLDDILACVQMIVACPAGAWIDQPGYGVPSLVFSQTPVDPSGIARAIGRWEPRAAAAASEYPDLVDAATRHVQVTVAALQADQ